MRVSGKTRLGLTLTLRNRSPARSPRISLFLPSLDGGGAERVFVQLANEFSARGVQIDVVLAQARGPYLEELSAGIRLVDLRASGVLGALPRLRQYLSTERPEVVLSGLDHANIIAILATILSSRRSRCVVSMRSVPSAVYRENKSVRGWVTLQLSRIAYRFADAVVANSKAVAADASRFFSVSRRALSVIYNPLAIDEIEMKSWREIADDWCRPESSPLILGVGRLDNLKDFPTLIRAFAVVRKRRDCRLMILGEGPDREMLKSLIDDLDLQNDVRLPGFVKNPFAWMRCSDLLVSSSLTEGCPNAILQALACGTPVVSTDCVGGSAEVLEGGRWGRLVAVGDVDSMADAIMASLDATRHPDGQQRVKDFARERIVEQYLQVLLPGSSRMAGVR